MVDATSTSKSDGMADGLLLLSGRLRLRKCEQPAVLASSSVPLVLPAAGTLLRGAQLERHFQL